MEVPTMPLTFSDPDDCWPPEYPDADYDPEDWEEMVAGEGVAPSQLAV